jgi:rhamnulokinase
MSRGNGLPGWVVAVDLGATSGRVMLGHVGPGVLSVEAVHRFPNEPVRTADGLHWNILELYRNVLVGLRKALEQRPELVSIGIDAWAVDYGLVRGNRMVSSPYHYRDERTTRGVELVHDVVDQEALYQAGGLQFLPFNTLYQLAVDRVDGVLDEATSMLMIPDLLGFWLTGEMVTERTNASTTGLLDIVSGDWNAPLIDKLGLPRTLLTSVADAGTVIGSLTSDVASEVRADTSVELVAVGSHDTASAVVAVPMTSRSAAYISSGTWSLVGVELDEPVLSAASREANFTNEGGVDGRVRYLHNVMGMWLLSESVRKWEREGPAIELSELLSEAAAIDAPLATFDANHPSLMPPGDMPSRIADLCRLSADPVPSTPAEFTRSILESLAAAYATALDDAERLSGLRIDTVHIVGGGSQNSLLCQLTADRAGRTVLAGPVEATAMGNVLVQGRTAGLVSGSLEDLRALVAQTYAPVRYDPRSGGPAGRDGQG